jgi:polyisoprenyl-teichoic acid--peptidoglycan teichoic acid transferase
MQPAHDTLARGRSPFAAAFLSLLFPGLGHAFLGAYRRGLGFAAPIVLLGALTAGFGVRLQMPDLFGIAIQEWFIIGLFVANLVLLVYRAYVIVDAWTIARALEGPVARSVPSVRQAGVVSIAGLLAVLLVMSVAHVAVARYNLILSNTTSCIFDDDGSTACDSGESPGPGEESPGASDGFTPPSTIGPAVTEEPPPDWNGKDRLNILLIGADEQGGGHRTDTLITVSIDPATRQVVMFQLPRDTVDVPLPPGPIQSVYGSVFPGKINSLFTATAGRPDWFPGRGNNTGYNALKATLGELYGLDIKYYVEVNFEGFKKVVDALGGVTINVQVPVLDDNFPNPNGTRERLYIPAGIQHMTGAEALKYARSRKSTSDFERGARQQRVLVSLREQMDMGQALQNIDALSLAIGQSLRTDIPRGIMPQLLGLADGIDARSIRSVSFTPPFYQVECLNCPPRGYIIQPRIDRIRAAVREAFNVDPNIAEAREALIAEGAEIWVLNGSGRTGEAARLSEFLSFLGMAATAPRQQPDVSGLQGTTVRAYNGAETEFPLTVEALRLVFGVEVEPVTDPAVRVDFVVITGVQTPQLTPPPVP